MRIGRGTNLKSMAHPALDDARLMGVREALESGFIDSVQTQSEALGAEMQKVRASTKRK